MFLDVLMFLKKTEKSTSFLEAFSCLLSFLVKTEVKSYSKKARREFEGIYFEVHKFFLLSKTNFARNVLETYYEGRRQNAQTNRGLTFFYALSPQVSSAQIPDGTVEGGNDWDRKEERDKERKPTHRP